MITENSEFNYKNIESLFENVRKGKSNVTGELFILSEAKGDVAEIIFNNGMHLMTVIVDNFPRQRKSYSSDMPLLTIKDFIRDLERIDLKLVPKDELKFYYWMEELKIIAHKFAPMEYTLDSKWMDSYFKTTYYDQGMTPQECWTDYTTMVN